MSSGSLPKLDIPVLLETPWFRKAFLQGMKERVHAMKDLNIRLDSGRRMCVQSMNALKDCKEGKGECKSLQLAAEKCFFSQLVPQAYAAYSNCLAGRTHEECSAQWQTVCSAASAEMGKTFEGVAGHPMQVRLEESYTMIKVCGGDTKSNDFLQCYPRLVCGEQYFAAQKCALANGGDLSACKRDGEVLAKCMGEWGFLPPKPKD